MAGRRQPVLREERICATVETAAKLKRDPLELAALAYRTTDGRDGLAPDLEQAVSRIRRAYSLITAPAAVRGQMYERRARGLASASDWAWKQIDRYCDWCDELVRRNMRVGRALAVILDDGEREWHGRDLEAVRGYAQIWVDLHG